MCSKEIMIVVNKLSDIYVFDINEAFVLLGYNLSDINISNIEGEINKDSEINKESENNIKSLTQKKLDSKLTCTKKINTVNKELPKAFDGIVYQDRCKAVVFNHGLYTQCTNKCTGEYCSYMCKKLKYGHINTRKDFPAGTYILSNGKREIKLSKLIKRLSKKEGDGLIERVYTQDSDDESHNSIENIVTKRGRPKKIKKRIEYREDDSEDDSEDDGEYDREGLLEMILVRKQRVDGERCYISEKDKMYSIKKN